MASQNRRTGPSLTDIVYNRGYEFEFFQAVRLLPWILPDRQPVGSLARPEDELVRFSAQLTLDFPPSPVHEVAKRAEGPQRMEVSFFGLTGTQGVLPHFYTEYLMQRAYQGDHGMAAFFDIFNHRLLSFFYRAWEKHHVFVTFERSVLTRGLDLFAERLYHLIGMGTPGLRGNLPLPDESLLFYAGLIAQRPHSASALRGILRDYFRVPVEITQCVGDWYALSQTDRSFMNRDGLHNQLGVGAVAGDEVWDQQSRFKVCVGPLSFDRFVELLPGTERLETMLAWLRFFAGPALAFDVNLILKASDVSWCALDDTAGQAARLGWASWLKTEEFDCNVFDVEFTYVN